MDQKISLFASYLKNANIILEKYKNLAITHAANWKQNHDLSAKFIEFVLSEYEENCIKMYLDENSEGKLFINTDNEELKKAIDGLS